MITRRALFLGSAAIITAPGLLMPVRKLAVPSSYVLEQVLRLSELLDNASLSTPSRWVLVHPEWKVGFDPATEIDRAALVTIGRIDGRVRIITSGYKLK